MKLPKSLHRIRPRQTFNLLVLSICFCGASIFLTILVRSGVLLARSAMEETAVSAFLFGFSIRDLLLFFAAIILGLISIFMFSKSTAGPIVTLNRATKEVAAGNFDVQVSLKESIQEFGELQTNFNAMVRELKSNEYLRKDFISNVSHELKTPLSIIGGYARLLEEGGLSEKEQREYSRFIAEESERLQKLCSDMLRLSKIENQNLGLKKQEFALDEQLRQAILLLQSKWEKKNISFRLELPPCRFYGDTELLLQVWQNLLDNGIKFSREKGEIFLSLREEKDGIQIRLEDFGEGMNDETRQRMFECFYQGDGSHKKEGSGLGLALVKRIVEMHKGSIQVNSTPGVGTCFLLLFPHCRGTEK